MPYSSIPEILIRIGDIAKGKPTPRALARP